MIKVTKIFILILAINGICGKERSIGGFDITETPFPHQASLRTFGHHICSGTIIDSKHILTSAKCLLGILGDIVDDLTVVTGTNNLVGGQGNQHYVDKIFIHENYDGQFRGPNGNNNIAIVRLTDDITFNNHQNYISLPNNKLLPNTIAKISGWNFFNYPVVVGNMVQQTIQIETVENNNCHKNNGLSCAIYKDKINGCIENDYGSALVSDGILIGFTIKELPCDIKYPIAFVDVFPYVDWIKNKINNP
ncbi:chymotrypsin-1-like isoform X2 [Aphidius gifuensis]|uniref:chymotrypsin-1-like isoform X2 n=1 Tax=Aphidius gifuensis TaxID=684658 RepID=UPI001CDBC8D3|nr:chymotrypsin-1-like isoform X2 [Aphidius gifuensis]